MTEQPLSSVRITGLVLPLDHSDSDFNQAVAKRLRTGTSEVVTVEVAKRSVDPRNRRSPRLVYTVDVEVADPAAVLSRCAPDQSVGKTPDTRYRLPQLAESGVETVSRIEVPRIESEVDATNSFSLDSPTRLHGDESGPESSVASHGRRVSLPPVVVGLGPCGLFAGLILAELGLRPIILERGKAVRERTVDTFGFWRGGALDSESNVQFGEGGAGTFSDGKLYSQVRDREHRGRKVLEEFVAAGAPKDILWQGRPHIGTFKLVKMVESLRAKILDLGGEIRFQTRVESLIIEDRGDRRSLRGVGLANGEQLRTDHLVLAVGHSARDTFEALVQAGVRVEPKPFSIGFRVEHPQAMVDECRYGRASGHPRLDAADYRLTHHCQGRGLEGRTVYSFCMCPGGTVVAAASEPGRVVTNGMSQYDRSERNANAGIVVDLEPGDFSILGGPSAARDCLAGVELQRRLESLAFIAGGSNYYAPVQLVSDLMADRASTALGDVVPSYKPGVTPTHLSECMPEFVIAAIREALPTFDAKLRGFLRNDAVFTGVETRTSSPVRVPRDQELTSVNTGGLYPAGEGAGYAGGILSAAIDGIRVAEAVARSLAVAGAG